MERPAYGVSALPGKRGDGLNGLRAGTQLARDKRVTLLNITQSLEKGERDQVLLVLLEQSKMVSRFDMDRRGSIASCLWSMDTDLIMINQLGSLPFSDQRTE